MELSITSIMELSITRMSCGKVFLGRMMDPGDIPAAPETGASDDHRSQICPVIKAVLSRKSSRHIPK